MNANIGFGRSIGPPDITKVQHNEIQILFHSLSEVGKSANITVEAEPIALVAFGLLAGEKITVNNVFRTLQTPMFYNGEALELTATNNVVMLAFAGVYNCTTTALLGAITLIAQAASTLDKNIDKVVGIANPNGPQAGTYYDGSAGVTFSQEFYIGNVPLVFRAYGITTQTIELQALFKDKNATVWEDNSVVQLTATKSTMVVYIAGRYRFKINGDSAGVILTNNPTDINFDSPYFKRGAKGADGIAVNTTGLPEGTNLYFTNERAQDAVALALVNSPSVTWVYDDAANTITATAAAAGGSGTQVPFEIMDGELFTVSARMQALFALPIEFFGTGAMTVDGALLEVS